MELEFVGLTINEEEEEVLQFQFEPQTGIEIHDIPGGFFSKRLAIQLGNFIGTFMEYDGSNLAKMALGVEVAEMRWDLSLRAQSRRALAMNSIWLREEDEGD
ncbi:hypothetical protein Gogos_020268 [Gossypium gossypioides]|uniref:Uncharacterized protein n=1 Tax=Gossypium gossypioides TaxID=34282 RepID=A0A7J9D0L0_GOSGO|nr:hypothetical protein [Gossypium gossypioides]